MNIHISQLSIGPLVIQGIARVQPPFINEEGATVLPSITFALKEDGDSSVSLLCSSQDVRALGEAMREVAQKKESSNWILKKRGLKLKVSSGKTTDETLKISTDWAWIVIEINNISESVPFSMWELRATIKQIDLFSDLIEGECHKMMKDKNFMQAKSEIEKASINDK